MLKDKEILEAAAAPLIDGEVGRRYKVRLIEGDRLGSTGYYPAETLRRDGPKIFKAGTPMYLNHLRPEDRDVRPHGSVQEYAGELSEDAFYENDGLYANIEVFEHQIPMIKALQNRIGISIRARGKVVNETLNGKIVPVFKELTEARSADFVVRAGAGGKIVSILESALEDSEIDSELEEEELVMDEATKAAFDGLALSQKATAETLTKVIEALEALKPKEEKKEEVNSEEAFDVLAAVKELSKSELSEEGRSRVLDMHKATKKPLADLIAAEEAYVNKSSARSTETNGFEESEESESEESALGFTMPSRWTKD